MEAYVLTNIGWVRTMNQNYTHSSPEGVGPLSNPFPVADDMGGHRTGDYVSRFTVESLVIYMSGAGDGSPVMQLKKGIEAVNGILYEESLKRGELEGVGCILVADVMEDNILYMANVEDSRLYLTYGGSVHQVIRNHSYMEETMAIGQMRRGSEGCNRRKNIITKALGTGREVESDFFEVDPEGRDYTLLCSGGLSNTLEDQSMYGIIAGEGSLKEKAALLVEEANRQGGVNNIAVVLVSPSGREADVC